MKRIKIGIIILILVMLVGLVSGAVALARSPFNAGSSDNGKAKHVQDEIIVKFRGDEKPFRVIKVPHGKVFEEIGKYQKRANVIYAEPNYIAHAFFTPNDPYYLHQWHLDSIQMEEAWDVSTGLEATVAIVDTGITQGTDLAGTCFVAGYDFVNDDEDPADDNGHGTHVAGTVAQSTDNNEGVAGIAFNACLMPVKVLDRNGAGTYADVALGILFAADNGAQVINLSLGGSASSDTLEAAVAHAYNNGVTVVAAAGNDGSSIISYPAAYDEYVIAVGATRYDETLAYYSNYGSNLDLVAPGGDLNVDQNEDGYGDGVLQQTFQGTGNSWRITWGYYFFHGTSMAAPHVAGTAALVIANGNATTPNEVRTALQETAKDLGAIGRDDIYGYGLINAYSAVNYSTSSEPECAVDSDCDDGLYCNGAETCVLGFCQSGTSVDCFGLSDQCNDGVCDEATDSCIIQPKTDDTPCDDGLFCTEDDYCSSGTCLSGTEKICDDSEGCTTDSCNEDLDACENTWPVCSLTSDECCGPLCDSTTDIDCPAASCLNCFKGICDGRCHPTKEDATCPDCP